MSTGHESKGQPQVSAETTTPRSEKRAVISSEAAVALILALVNLALDQADIHIMIISWMSVLACIALSVDILRRSAWAKHPVYGWRVLSVGSGGVVVLFVLFGTFLTMHHKAAAKGLMPVSNEGKRVSSSAQNTSVESKNKTTEQGQAVPEFKHPEKRRPVEQNGITARYLNKQPAPRAQVTAPSRDAVPPPVVNIAPGGFINSGSGTLDHPTLTNNYGIPSPPPNVTIESTEDAAGVPKVGPSNLPQFDGNPGIRALISVDGDFVEPNFIIKCDLPCVATDLELLGGMSQCGFVTNPRVSNITRITFKIPAKMTADDKASLLVKSMDSRPIRIERISAYAKPMPTRPPTAPRTP